MIEGKPITMPGAIRFTSIQSMLVISLKFGCFSRHACHPRQKTWACKSPMRFGLSTRLMQTWVSRELLGQRRFFPEIRMVVLANI